MDELIALVHEVGPNWLFLAAIISIYVGLVTLLIWRMDDECGVTGRIESSADQAQSVALRGAREGIDE